MQQKTKKNRQLGKIEIYNNNQNLLVTGMT